MYIQAAVQIKLGTPVSEFKPCIVSCWKMGGGVFFFNSGFSNDFNPRQKILTENSGNSALTSLIVFHARILGEIFCGIFLTNTFLYIKAY